MIEHVDVKIDRMLISFFRAAMERIKDRIVFNFSSLRVVGGKIQFAEELQYPEQEQDFEAVHACALAIASAVEDQTDGKLDWKARQSGNTLTRMKLEVVQALAVYLVGADEWERKAFYNACLAVKVPADSEMLALFSNDEIFAEMKRRGVIGVTES